MGNKERHKKKRGMSIGLFICIVTFFGVIVIPASFQARSQKKEQVVLHGLSPKYLYSGEFENSSLGFLLGKNYNRCKSIRVRSAEKLEADFFESMSNLKYLRYLDLGCLEVDESALAVYRSRHSRVLVVREKTCGAALGTGQKRN